MRPKPTREWVMLELERLGVRVVSGRLKSGGPGGNGAGLGEDDGGSDGGDSVGDGGDTKGVNNNNMSGVSFFWCCNCLYENDNTHLMLKIKTLCIEYCWIKL